LLPKGGQKFACTTPKGGDTVIILEVIMTAWTFGVPIVDVFRMTLEIVKNMKITDPFS